MTQGFGDQYVAFVLRIGIRICNASQIKSRKSKLLSI